VKLLSPVANPGKIIGAPVNYRKGGEDDAAIAAALSIGLFLKANSSLAGPSEGIALRMMERQIDHEVELGVIIGRQGCNIAREQALDYVAGYAVALDITPHGKEERSLRKSCETYSVLGPWLVTADEIPDPANLDLALAVNGEPRQKGNTRQMLRDVAALIEYASSFYTLYPGDIFLSGTPAASARCVRATRSSRQSRRSGRCGSRSGQRSAVPVLSVSAFSPDRSRRRI
jgi:2-keto-4-pentenoate hydratase/2-oxohepta-3-ene-1,7-dioic acid hydratase in catechol pathway